MHVDRPTHQHQWRMAFPVHAIRQAAAKQWIVGMYRISCCVLATAQHELKFILIKISTPFGVNIYPKRVFYLELVLTLAVCSGNHRLHSTIIMMIETRNRRRYRLARASIHGPNDDGFGEWKYSLLTFRLGFEMAAVDTSVAMLLRRPI